jgi:hypothetical protein
VSLHMPFGGPKCYSRKVHVENYLISHILAHIYYVISMSTIIILIETRQIGQEGDILKIVPSTSELYGMQSVSS